MRYNAVAANGEDVREITLDGTEVEYRVRFSKRRTTIGATIDEHGLRVSLPHQIKGEGRERTFLQKRSVWVLNNLEKMEERLRQIPNRTFEEGETMPLYGSDRIIEVREGRSKITRRALVVGRTDLAGSTIEEEVKRLYFEEARRYFKKKLDVFAEKMGVEYSGVTVKHKSSSWGSFSGKTRRVHMNVLLMLAPAEVIDYVLIHELCHARVPGHGRDFWQMVEEHCPDYRKHEKWLDREGHRLVWDGTRK